MQSVESRTDLTAEFAISGLDSYSHRAATGFLHSEIAGLGQLAFHATASSYFTRMEFLKLAAWRSSVRPALGYASQHLAHSCQSKAEAECNRNPYLQKEVDRILVVSILFASDLRAYS